MVNYYSLKTDANRRISAENTFDSFDWIARREFFRVSKTWVEHRGWTSEDDIDWLIFLPSLMSVDVNWRAIVWFEWQLVQQEVSTTPVVIAQSILYPVSPHSFPPLLNLLSNCSHSTMIFPLLRKKKLINTYINQTICLSFIIINQSIIISSINEKISLDCTE